MKEVEIINLAAESVKSAFLVVVQLQDKWIRLQSVAVEMQWEAPPGSSFCWFCGLPLDFPCHYLTDDIIVIVGVMMIYDHFVLLKPGC